MASISDYITRFIDRLPGIQEAGMSLSSKLHDIVLSSPAMRHVTDVLHGKQAGHPIHPILIYFPIGAWVLGSAFDLASLMQSSRHAKHSRRVADDLLNIGTVTAVPTVLTGLADYSGLPEEAIKVGTLHAMFNVAALTLYGLSVVSRKNRSRELGIGLSLAGMGAVLVSGYLGGDLVYRLQVGVNRNLPPSPDELGRWRRALAVDELTESKPTRVELDDKAILLYRRGDEIYAVSAVCSHDGGPLEKGKFDGRCVECPWHHSIFDLADGSVVHGPAVFSLPVYRVRKRAGYIEVRTTPEEPAETPPQLKQMEGARELEVETANR